MFKKTRDKYSERRGANHVVPSGQQRSQEEERGLKIEMGAGVVAQCMKKLVNSPSILSLIPRTHRVEREHISQIALYLLYAHHGPCAPPINNK